MSKKLTYGTEAIRLADDADITKLRNKITLAANGDGWVHVPTKGEGHHWIYIQPGIPVMIDEREPSGARAVVVG